MSEKHFVCESTGKTMGILFSGLFFLISLFGFWGSYMLMSYDNPEYMPAAWGALFTGGSAGIAALYMVGTTVLQKLEIVASNYLAYTTWYGKRTEFSVRDIDKIITEYRKATEISTFYNHEGNVLAAIDGNMTNYSRMLEWLEEARQTSIELGQRTYDTKPKRENKLVKALIVIVCVIAAGLIGGIEQAIALFITGVVILVVFRIVASIAVRRKNK